MQLQSLQVVDSGEDNGSYVDHDDGNSNANLGYEDLELRFFDTTKDYTGQTELNDLGSQLVPRPFMSNSNFVNYAKKATRVDVKQLKENMWKEIENTVYRVLQSI